MNDPEYDKEGDRVYRFSDDDGLRRVCDELFPVLRAHFEGRAGLADLPTTDDGTDDGTDDVG